MGLPGPGFLHNWQHLLTLLGSSLSPVGFSNNLPGPQAPPSSLLGCRWLPSGLAGSSPAPGERPKGSASLCPPGRPCSPAPASSWLPFSAAARRSFCPCRLRKGASFGAPRRSSHLNHWTPPPRLSGRLAWRGPSTTPLLGMVGSRGLFPPASLDTTQPRETEACFSYRLQARRAPVQPLT